jgi:protein-tyrosine kinase
MSKFSKALEQAQRDRALGARPGSPENAPGAESPFASGARKIPHPEERFPDFTGDDVDDHLVSLVAPAGLHAEQYRALRHMVELKHKTDNVSLIAVSSPGAGDGKTITAINLAGALAQAPEARVLLVEADLRRPTVGSLLGFGDAGDPGLVDAILDPNLMLADIVHPRPPFNLSVVLAGQTPPSPYEVLKAPRLGALLAEARRDYDYVVLDTPPLAGVQDCRVIAHWMDGILIVVAAHHTPQPLLEAALDVLDPLKVIGVIFNASDQLVSGRYGGHYSAYVTHAGSPPADTSSRFSRAAKTVASLLPRRGGGAGRSRRARERSR